MTLERITVTYAPGRHRSADDDEHQGDAHEAGQKNQMEMRNPLTRTEVHRWRVGEIRMRASGTRKKISEKQDSVRRNVKECTLVIILWRRSENRMSQTFREHMPKR